MPADPLTTGARAPLARATQPGADHLAEVFELLWPAPSQVRVVRRWRGGQSLARGARTDFAAVPDARRPRVVVPLRSRRLTAAAVAAARTSSSRRTRLQVGLLSAAARAGAARLLPDRVQVAAAPDADADITRRIEQSLGREVAVALLVGPLRAAQKPVLQVLSPDGALLGFAKLGVNDLTRPLVRREAEVLRDLGARDLTAVRVPAVAHHGTWNGHELLVQEALTDGVVSHDLSPAVLAAMVQVAGVHGSRCEPLAHTAFWRRITEVADRHATHPVVGRLAPALAAVARARGTDEVRLGAWHGDWAPWNMLVQRDGARALVWDWETFEDDVPAGLDRVHFQVQRDVVLADVDPALALSRMSAQAAQALEPFGVGARQARLVVLLYVLRLLLGHVETGEQHSRLSRVDQWLPRWLPDAVRDVTAEGAEGR